MKLTGMHHLTAMASNPARNVAFYTRVLGLRLVKKTVNFDDPGTYHLYYGDESGAPGTILTFFPWPDAKRGIPGVGQTTAFSFQIPLGAIPFWKKHLEKHQVELVGESERFGEKVLGLRDPDGFLVELIETAEPMTVQVWSGSVIPTEHALHGFHGATLSLEAQERTGSVLTGIMGAKFEQSEGNRFRYTLGEGAEQARIDLLCLPAGRFGTGGSGIIHHIAWRTPDDASEAVARAELMKAGFNVSPVMDRNYFHSIYYREPGGVLFEIATDHPGFAVDESAETLGEKLMLPTWLEPHRSVLEKALPSLES